MWVTSAQSQTHSITEENRLAVMSPVETAGSIKIEVYIYMCDRKLKKVSEKPPVSTRLKVCEYFEEIRRNLIS